MAICDNSSSIKICGVQQHYQKTQAVMSQDQSKFVTFDVVRELLSSQERPFTAAVQLVVSDIKDELRFVKRENQELKLSLEFTKALLKDALDKDTEYENKLEGLKLRTNETDDYIKGIEDQLENLENESRRNNVKIMGIDEDLKEKTWDDTEKVVRKIIREKLSVEEKTAIERAHRAGERPCRRHPGLMGQRSMTDPDPSL